MFCRQLGKTHRARCFKACSDFIKDFEKSQLESKARDIDISNLLTLQLIIDEKATKARLEENSPAAYKIFEEFYRLTLEVFHIRLEIGAFLYAISLSNSDEQLRALCFLMIYEATLNGSPAKISLALLLKESKFFSKCSPNKEILDMLMSKFLSSNFNEEMYRGKLYIIS